MSSAHASAACTSTAMSAPARAVVVTSQRLVRIEWFDVAGDWCWFSSGTWDAKREAVPAIKHIEKMCQTMH